MKIPVLVVMALERFDAVGRAVDRLFGDADDTLWKRPPVIDLRVVGNHVVDLLRVDLLFKMIDILFRKGRPDRVDHGHLLLLDQVGIVGGSTVGRILVAVKFPALPVALADPGDVVLDEPFTPFVLLSLLVCRHRNSRTIYAESPPLRRIWVQASCRSALPPF